MSELTPSTSEEKFCDETDDAAICWAMLSCPFTELTRTNTAKTLSLMSQRFLEILDSPELMKSVNELSSGDVINYKPLPFSPREALSLCKQAKKNPRMKGEDIIASNPYMFHPSRTTEQMMVNRNRLSNLPRVKDKFEIFKHYINEQASDLTIEPVQTEEIEAVRKALDLTGSYNKLPPGFTAMDLRDRALTDFANGAIAVLVGANETRPITKKSTTFGRASPLVNPDFDLSDMNLQSISRLHIRIDFCSDLHFYLTVCSKSIFINGCIFWKDQVIILHDCDVIDFGGAIHVFFENTDFIQRARIAAAQ